MTDETSTLNNETATSEAVAAPGKPRFVNQAARARRIPLDWPLEFGGKTYDGITVRRMSGTEVMAHQEALEEARKSDAKANIPFPMFDDDQGAPIPVEVFNILDDDDAEKIWAAAYDFLPRRYREAASG